MSKHNLTLILLGATLLAGCQSTPNSNSFNKPQYVYYIPEGSEEYRFIKAVENNICTGKSIIDDPVIYKVLKDGYMADSAIQELGTKGYEHFLNQWGIGSFKYLFPYGDYIPQVTIRYIKQHYC